LIDSGVVDVVHGHSSHHVRPLEIYRGKLIIYGAGDFLNDYEGIEGNESYRDDLVLMYFPTLESGTGRLTRLRIIPLQIFRFSLRRTSMAEAAWLKQVINRESSQFGTRARLEDDGHLEIELDQP
jgi:poly-gamma-glutamate capsule biosynthesis protein CapA/YwtB (metallophosphatase superfamily)